MARMSRWLTLAAVAAGTAGLATMAWGATGWTIVSPPATPANTNDVINGAYARTDTDVWAVGATYVAAGAAPAGPISMHWNGSTWSTVPTPAPDSTQRFRGLTAVGASAAGDAWAVGFSLPVSGGYNGVSNSLYEHWNGTAWSTVAGPNIGELVGVADFGPSDAWAVAVNGTAAQWNGTAWTAVTTPAPDPSDTALDKITSLSADGPNDLWAVGTYDAGLFSLHYDGTAWHVVPMAQPTSVAPGPGINGVSALSPTDVWAVGETPNDPVIEHFNGTSWQLATAPSGLFYPVLSAISARSDSDIWVFGHAYSDSAGSSSSQVFAHWNGTSWSRTPSPYPANTYVALSSATNSPSHFWAFGTNPNNQPLILRYP